MSALIVHDWVTGPDSLSRILESTPQLAPRLQVNGKQIVQQSALVPGKFIFETDKPFAARDRFEAWEERMFARLDGLTTVANVFEDVKADATMPDRFRLEDFVALISQGLEAGYLVLPELTLLSAQSG